MMIDLFLAVATKNSPLTCLPPPPGSHFELTFFFINQQGAILRNHVNYPIKALPKHLWASLILCTQLYFSNNLSSALTAATLRLWKCKLRKVTSALT